MYIRTYMLYVFKFTTPYVVPESRIMIVQPEHLTNTD